MSRKRAALTRGRRSEAGDVLVSSLRIKVFAKGNKTSTLRVLKPTAGKGWNEKGVDTILDKIAEDLEQRFPTEEFRLVELERNVFNFVHAGPLPPEEITAKLEKIAEEKNDGAPEVGIQGGE